jgi:uncharacterized protein
MHIFLHNTNLMTCLQPHNVNVGSARKTFFVNILSNKYQINTTSQGDFLISDTFRFEIGGQSKTTKKIAGPTDSYIVVDDIEIGRKNKIPLWLFGFLS